jgi:hypothetical protein
MLQRDNKTRFAMPTQAQSKLYNSNDSMFKKLPALTPEMDGSDRDGLACIKVILVKRGCLGGISKMSLLLQECMRGMYVYPMF